MPANTRRISLRLDHGELMWILQNVTLTIAVAAATWCFATLVCLVWYAPKLASYFTQHIPMLIPDLRHCEFPGDACGIFCSDGTRLSGTFWRSDAAVPRGSVVLCHEVGGESACLNDVAQFLVEAGFDVLAFDFRNHGESGPGAEYSKLPWLTTRDVDDVLAAVGQLRELSPDALVGVYGVSRGASAALCAASCDPHIRAVVADGPFPIYDMMLPHLRRRLRLGSTLGWIWERMPDFWVLFYCRAAVRLAGHRMGCRFVDTRARARSIRQPVLLIRGELDCFVPPSVAEKLRLSIRGKTEVWQVPGSKHNAGRLDHPLEYRQIVCHFFATHLNQTERPTVASGSTSPDTTEQVDRRETQLTTDDGRPCAD